MCVAVIETSHVVVTTFSGQIQNDPIFTPDSSLPGCHGAVGKVYAAHGTVPGAAESSLRPSPTH